MTSRMRHIARARAFSLLEVTLVMAILAIMLGIAAPRYHHALANYRADAAARRIVADLHAARRAAEQTSRARTVTFDLEAHTLAYTAPSINQQGEPEHRTRLADEPYMATLRRVDFDGGHTVSFDGFGKPDTGGRVVVRADGRERAVRLDAASGQASVE